MSWLLKVCCRTRVGFVVFAALLAGAGLAALDGGAATARSLPPSPPSQGPLTASQLARNLRAARFITKMPADLTPSLSDHHAWGPLIVENGCQLSRTFEVRSPPCVYGDPTATTPVVLFGDSHAGMWFPALDQISRQMHWQLLIFTKAGCAPPEVKLYAQCNTWRKNSEAQIAAIHPAIVFVSWARWIEAEAKPQRGVPTTYGSTWADGVAAIFKFLHQSADRVIFMSDDPTFYFGGAHCVARHMNNLKPCNDTPRRKVIFLPKVRAQEFQLARRMHVSAIDPTSWFCTPTVCPVVVGSFLVYYDSAHMTPPWSEFIAPVLSTTLTSLLSEPPGASAS